MWDEVSEAVFWVTGGVVYLLPLTLLVVGPILLKWVMSPFSSRALAAALALLWGLLVGNSIELLVIPAALFVVAFVGIAWRTNKLACLMLIAGFLIGVLILIFAPGNFARAASGGTSLQTSILALVANFVGLAKRLTYHSGVLGIAYLALLLAVSVAFIVSAVRRGRLPFPELGWWRLAPVAAVAVGYASYLPLALAPEYVAGRTFVYFFFALSVSALCLTRCGMAIFAAGEVPNRAIAAVALAGTALVALQIFLQLPVAAAAQSAFWDRHMLLLESAGQDVVVSPLLVDGHLSLLHTGDVASDPTHWLNACFTDFYGLGSIRLSAE